MKDIFGNLAFNLIAVLVLVVVGLVSNKWGLAVLAYLVLGAAYRALYVHNNRR